MNLTHSIARKVIAVVAFAVTIICTAETVKAAGTPAGTVITNQATATYNAANGDPLPQITSNAVSVTVAQLAAVNITPPTAFRTARLNTTVDYASTVTNSGNGTDEFDLAASSSLGFSASIYHDVDEDGVLSASEISAGAITRTHSLAADASMRIITRLVISADTALNGQTDVLALTATSVFDPSVSDAASYSTLISSAALAFTKSVDITGPRGGDRVTYTLAYTNSGGGDATNVIVTDVLNGNLTYVTGSSTPPPLSVSGQTITWNLGTVPASSSGSITFQVDVVSNAIPGTEIHNIASVDYNDGPNARSITSNEFNFITVQSGGAVTVNFTPIRTGSGEPGDTIAYAFVVTNNGGIAESFDLSTSSTEGLTWVMYHDANGNEQIDSGEPIVTGTGSLPGGGGQFRIVARTILPLVPVDQTLDVTTFRATSTANADNFKTTTGSTTINIPVMSLTKSASAPDPRPGREITYTITYTNSGHGRAIQFTVNDSVPANTTYVVQSVRLNGASKTDQSDGDEVVVSGGVVAVSVGTVLPQSSGTIEFRVRIN